MKLRNKKTGEIIDIYKGEITLHYNQGRKTIHFKRLEDLEEWEDYEETEGWYIDISCIVKPTEPFFSGKNIDILKQCGNYFETKEEAEKAVEKLKAWKRLKDKGFKFEGIAGIKNEIYFTAHKPFSHIMFDEYTADENEKQYVDDLMLLFGGENG